MRTSGSDIRIEEIPNGFATTRGVGLLVCPNDPFVNAVVQINALSGKLRNLLPKLYVWLDLWATGQPMGFCNGYDKTEYSGKYTMCYQFEVGKSRLYGFLCNPYEERKRFTFFVGVHVLEKHYWRTEETVLKRLAELSCNDDVLQAARNFAYGYGRRS